MLELCGQRKFKQKNLIVFSVKNLIFFSVHGGTEKIAGLSFAMKVSAQADTVKYNHLSRQCKITKFYLSTTVANIRTSSRKLVQCLIESKKSTKNFTTSYSTPFVGVLYQNKSLHNFQKRGQRPIAKCIKVLDQDLNIQISEKIKSLKV